MSATPTTITFFWYVSPILYCRWDLVVVANRRKEKTAPRLLNPFVVTSSQGYTILHQPDPKAGAPWFTEGTVVRFVVYLSVVSCLFAIYPRR